MGNGTTSGYVKHDDAPTDDRKLGEPGGGLSSKFSDGNGNSSCDFEESCGEDGNEYDDEDDDDHDDLEER